jgi:hypothetical protein
VATNFLTARVTQICTVVNFAADTVCYFNNPIVPSRLLFEIEPYAITGKLFSWIRGFVSNGLQYVVIHYFHLPACFVGNTVLEGSVPGPILFIICTDAFNLIA